MLRGNQTEYPKSSLSDIFKESIQAQPGLPDKTAVTDDQSQISFRELDDLSSIISKHITQGQGTLLFPHNAETEGTGHPVEAHDGTDVLCSTEGSTVGPVVGVFIPECVWRPVVLLALVKAGAVYVPLDPVLPKERMLHVIDQSKVDVILYHGVEYENIIRGLDIDVQQIDIETLIGKASYTEAHDTDLLKDDKYLDRVFCILYTSGSTGVPKKITLTNGNIMNRLHWQWEEFPFKDGDICSHKTSPLFVDSVSEILGAILKAVPLVVIRKHVLTDIGQFFSVLHYHQVTRLVVVPSLLRNMVHYMQQHTDEVAQLHLKYITSSGEVLNQKLLMGLLDVYPNIVLLNLYGSTETTGDVLYETYTKVKPIIEVNGFISIGKPVSNTNVCVITEQNLLAEEGEIGEIWISGKNINKSADVNDKFAINRFTNDRSHEILYNTGDLGLVKGGRLYYQGRRDSQIKLRGYRVNLKEVEHAVSVIQGVDEVVVLPCTQTHGDVRMVAFYMNELYGAVSRHDIHNTLKAKLPSYMIPVLMEVDVFPLQPHTGKTDRMAILRNYKQQCKSSGTGSKNAHDSIIQLIARTLSVPVGMLDDDSDLSEVGADSLSIINIVSSLTENGHEIQLHQILKHSRIGDIINMIETNTECPGQSYPACTSSSFDYLYQIRDVCDFECSDEAMHMAADSFHEMNPVDMLLDVSHEKRYAEIAEVWDDCAHLSIAVTERKSGSVIGISLLLNVNSYPPYVTDRPEQAVRAGLFSVLTEHCLMKGGKWLYENVHAVSTTVPDDMRLAVLAKMCEKTLDIARLNGFKGVVTVNTNHVTCEMSSILGYEVLDTVHPKTFVYEGTTPFASAPEYLLFKAMAITC